MISVNVPHDLTSRQLALAIKKMHLAKEVHLKDRLLLAEVLDETTLYTIIETAYDL